MTKYDVQEYSNQLEKDLNLFEQWHTLIENLIDTESLEVILDILKKIVLFDLHQSKMVRIDTPKWFPATHWVTVAFAQIARNASLNDIEIILPQAQRVAEIHFSEWPNASFRFVKAPLDAGGYYLEETAQELRVVYWDIFDNRFYLDTEQFSKLVQTEAIQLGGVAALAVFQQRLTNIAKQLSEIGYDSVLPGMDNTDQDQLFMRQKELLPDVLDSLFVKAAEQQFILKKMKSADNGVEINIGEVAIQLAQSTLSEHQTEWYYKVVDENKDITIYTLFQQLPFFYKWYQTYINVVGLRDKREVFVD